MSEERFEALFAKRPCIGCIFYGACGSMTRTEHCNERMSKSEFLNLGKEKKSHE